MNETIIKYGAYSCDEKNLETVNDFLADVINNDFRIDRYIAQAWFSDNVQERLQELLLYVYQKTYYMVQR